MTSRGEEGPRIRVLWLIKGLGPGGAEGLLVGHARHADGAEITYRAAYLRPEWSHRAPALREAGVQVTCLDAGGEWDLRWAIRLRRTLLDHPVEVIHIHSPSVASVARIVLRTIRPGRRPAILYTEHNRWPHHNRLTRFANRITFGLNDATMAVSMSVRDSITHRMSDSTQVVIHGIEGAEFEVDAGQRAAVREELGVGGDDILVGTVANLRPSKAYPVLLRAARRALDRDQRVRFVAAGVGPMAGVLEKLHGDLCLGDRFSFLGFRDDVGHLLGAMDIFVLASNGEALGIAILEAMAAGLPVVATRAGGVPEIVTDGVQGLLVPANDHEALADAIMFLVSNPDRRVRMGSAARERGASLDVVSAVTIIESCYRELTARR